MTEQEWLASADPKAMLCLYTTDAIPWPISWPGPIVTNRKLRLFACACCRQVWHLLSEKSREVVAAAERYADAPSFAEQLIFAVAFLGDNLQPSHVSDFSAWYVSRQAPIPDTYGTFPYSWPDVATQAALLRCIIGNPFRPLTIDPTWRTPTALSLVRTAYEQRERKCKACGGKGGFLPYEPGLFQETCRDCHGTGRINNGTLDPDRLAVLADALEDAGCTEEVILSHLRGPGPHARGCHILDLLLGKE